MVKENGPQWLRRESARNSMNRTRSAVSRRKFLKQSAAVGLGIVTAGRFGASARAASKERVTILSSSVTDTLNPYNHSGSLIYGMWQDMYEPLIDVAYRPVTYHGGFAAAGELQGED